MWSYLKSLAMRTMLSLSCLAMLSVNRTDRAEPPAPKAAVAASPAITGSIGMTIASAPAVESRLPRGNIILAKAVIDASPQHSAVKPAADTAEILLFQAIIAQAEVASPPTSGPTLSSGGSGGGSPRRAPDPDLPPAFDQRFGDWQKDADIKLNEEKSQAKGKEHPLAIANPESYLVICLGGCRPSSDEIVYRVSKTAAAAAVIAQRRMETTAAEIAGGSDKKPEQLEENAVACIAGCYANADVSPAIKPKRAEGPQKSRANRIAGYVRAPKMQAVAAVTSAHRISAETRGHIAKKRVANVIRDTQTWRTKIVFATKKAARLAAKRDRFKRAAVTNVFRGRGGKRSTIVTEASGFIF